MFTGTMICRYVKRPHVPPLIGVQEDHLEEEAPFAPEEETNLCARKRGIRSSANPIQSRPFAIRPPLFALKHGARIGRQRHRPSRLISHSRIAGTADGEVNTQKEKRGQIPFPRGPCYAVKKGEGEIHTQPLHCSPRGFL